MKARQIHGFSVLTSMIGTIALLWAIMAPAAGAELLQPMPRGAQAKGPVPDQYIVVLKDSVAKPGRVAERHSENRGAQVQSLYRHAIKGYAAKLSQGELAAIKADPAVAYVERDYRGGIAAQTTPTGIDRVFATANEALAINEEEDVVVDANVAVLDTAVDASHPDLDVVGEVNCQNGCAEEASTGGGHGTHVAGTVAAIDNQFGVVGVAPGARIWSVRVLTSEGFGNLSEFIAGIDWVTSTREDEDPENDIEVANSSLRYWGVEDSNAFEEAIEASLDAGIVHVVAAGNESETVRYVPGNHPDVITVSALEDLDGSVGEGDDPLAWFSNFGTVVDIAAPGVEILSTFPGNSYGAISGTSMASPHVAGGAAFLASQTNPASREDVEAIRDTLVGTGNFDWVDTSEDGEHEPLLDLVGSPVAVTLSASEVKGVSAKLQGAVNPKGSATSYQFEYGKTTAYGSKIPVSPESIGAGSEFVLVDESLEGLASGTTYHFRVVAIHGSWTTPGADQTFTTRAPPKASTQASTGVSSGGATLNATVNPGGLPTTYQFEYGTTTSYGTTVPVPAASAGSGESNVNVSKAISGLSKGTTYHYRVMAANDEGTSFGEDQEFTTLPDAPAVITGAASSVGGTRATLNATINPNESGTTYRFLYSDLVSFHEVPIPPKAIGSGSVSVEVQELVKGLKPSTTYYFVAVASNAGGTTSGELQEFTTTEGTPTFSFAFGKGSLSDGQFSSAVGVAIDSEGDIWVTDRENHRVQQFKSNGEYLSQFGAQGSGNGQLSGPRGVAIDSEGDVWVADRSNHRVQQFKSNGEYLSQFGTKGSGNGQLWYPEGVAIDAEGDIWVTDGENHRVQQFKPNGEYLSKFGTSGSGDAQFGYAHSIAIDSEGDIWVTDSGNNRVQQFKPNGEYLSKFGTFGAGDAQFWHPEGIAVDSQGDLWVVDSRNHRVEQVTPTGEYLSSLGSKAGSADGHLDNPINIAIDSEGDLWVTDSENHRVQQFDSEGEYLSQFGKKGWTGDGSFIQPTGIAIDSEGNIWVADAQNNRVQKFKPNGEYLSQFGTKGEGNGQLSGPLGIEIDSEGDIWVNDSGNHRVQQFDSEGEYLSQFGVELYEPQGFAIDAEGDIWVVDNLVCVIKQFDSNGEFLSQIGEEGQNCGSGIEIDSEGDVWVTDSEADRVRVFKPNGELVRQFGESGSGEGQFYLPTGIAIDAHRDIWIADFSVIQMWSLE